jgi:hypothetical protein
MSKLLEDLVPEALFKAVHAMAELADKTIPVCIVSTLRTDREQAALHLQGRASLEVVNAAREAAGMKPIGPDENKYTVTNCDGVRLKSRHQSGRALDVVPREGVRPVWPGADDPRWKQISDVMKKAGFTWGGDWTAFLDLPHFELPA